MSEPGNETPAVEPVNLLKQLDYSIAQQCIHCGMCLPTCPTYDLTKQERHSPRGRIALMRAIADGRNEVSTTFAKEMYYCLGCLACKTACPAGVDYPHLFETARAEIERSEVNTSPKRKFIRWFTLRFLFAHHWLLHLFGRSLYFYKASGLQTLVRKSGILRLMPENLREMETLTPEARARFSAQLIRPIEVPSSTKYTVGLLTGCVQDILYSEVSRATADVLLAAECKVVTPRAQLCCGSLHAHNGDLPAAREFARKLIDQFDLGSVDAIITNAGGCGSHLKDYAHLLESDSEYTEKAAIWSTKVKDIHEFLVQIGFDRKLATLPAPSEREKITYHDSCHLAHGQGINRQPRLLLKSLPTIELVELPEAAWCCGSAGVYNLTHPKTAAELGDRKLENILGTGCAVVATGNPGCLLQLSKRAEARGVKLRVVHPVEIIANALTSKSSIN